MPLIHVLYLAQYTMPNFIRCLDALCPQGIALLRISVGVLILLHGTAKLFGIPAEMVNEVVPPLFSPHGLAGLIQTLGGICLILGLFTRYAAFLLSGTLAVAYLGWKASLNDWWLPAVNGGEDAVLYSLIFFTLFIVGGGAYALDNRCSTSAAKSC